MANLDHTNRPVPAEAAHRAARRGELPVAEEWRRLFRTLGIAPKGE